MSKLEHPDDDSVNERLNQLQANINEIIESIEARRGSTYNAMVVNLFSTFQQVAEIERQYCYMFSTFSEIHKPSDEMQQVHDMLHMMSKASIKQLATITQILGEQKEFSGIMSDLIILGKRINHDWFGVRG